MGLISKCLSVLKGKGLRYFIMRVFVRVLDVITFAFLGLRYKNSPPENIIVMESHNDFDCNTGAFYEYLLRNGINSEYKIVWLIKNRLDRELPQNVYAFGYFGFSFRKNSYIIRARYLMCEDGYIKKRRSCQTAIYCTHGGVGFKNIKGLIVIPDYIDYILSASEYYDPIVCEAYSIKYPNSRMLHFGYPFTDTLFTSGREELDKLGLPASGKYILWMPTLRKSNVGRVDSTADEPYGLPMINDEKQIDELNAYLRSAGIVMLIKMHPLQDMGAIRRIEDRSNIIQLDAQRVKEKGLDGYRLMAASDAMISDYSGSAYAFLLLNRPLGFVLSDLEQYKLGFCVSNYMDYLPGAHIYTFDDLYGFITDVARGNDNCAQEREQLLKKLYEHYDGKACERLARFLGLKTEDQA